MVKHQRGAVTAVMNMSLFVLLLLSGLLCSASGLWREYQYINRNMTWSEAQSYCRQRYTDLATVDSMDDVNTMINLTNGYSGSVWLGLTRKNQSSWGWSVGDNSLAQYSAWDSANASSEGECAYSNNKTWFATSCSTKLYFLCYMGDSYGYIWAKFSRNWTYAQNYCRENYIDLVSIHKINEQERLYTIGMVWIGLFLDSWQWSDQWNQTFRNWATGKPSNRSGSDCVAMSLAAGGKWANDNCTLQRPFICHGTQMNRKQIIRLNLSSGEKSNLNDSVIQTATMNEIHEKMQSLGLGSYNDVTWIKDEGGEVFHMEINRTQSNIKCDGN